MTRPARAVLIAVPDTAWAPDDTLPRAVETARSFGGFLERRFAEATIAYVTPEAGPVTKARVLDALAQASPAPGELFVVLFFGHGIPADDDHPYQAWGLTQEELSDLELAVQLHRLPDGVDTVVISDCCYGRGFHNAGPRSLRIGAPAPVPTLRQLSRAFASRMHEAVSAPMVCISAAGPSVDRGAVLGAVAPQLVAEVMAAAERGASYRSLDEKFRREQFAGREFYVDARPANRLAHLVLDTQVLPCAGDDRGSRARRAG